MSQQQTGSFHETSGDNLSEETVPIVLESPQVQSKIIIDKLFEISNENFVGSYELQRTITNLEETTPFMVRRTPDGITVSLPSNIEELVRENYFYKIYIRALRILEYNIFMLEKKSHKNFPMDSLKDYLKGFGTAFAKAEVIPYEPIMKGEFLRGLLSSMKVKTSVLEDLDQRFYRFFDSQSPVQDLFGTVWGQRNPVEKNCLDTIILALRKCDMSADTLSSYLAKAGKIKERIGWKTNLHNNKLFDSEEKSYIATKYQVLLTRDLVIPNAFSSLSKLIEWQQDKVSFIKELKPYKTLCRSIIDRRAKVVFKKEKSNRKQKSVPVDQLINNLKGTYDFVEAFTPIPLMTNGFLVFKVSGYPQNLEAYNNILTQLGIWLEKNKTNISDQDSVYIYNWYANALNRF
jgi:hypothetical protein